MSIYGNGWKKFPFKKNRIEKKKNKRTKLVEKVAWILEKVMITWSKQMIFILETCLDDNHLFYTINEKNTDSVLTRSFSALVITEIIKKDAKANFLSESHLKKSVSSCFSYLYQEKDIRGYVENKGWAHSIAHSSDLLEAIISHPLFNSQCFRQILQSKQRSMIVHLPN
ncbi:DUF2785 domain-containing protein [Caldifermentibacillus hisashii]|uniref:DUF2785 domain-containing protein n=1 Tax=Caldifermentibacillus hisashii TaxID=996558 RepID=UPI003D15DE47